ncbi:MAG: DMT family transporter [Pseudomonadota bacterium]
MTDPAAPIKPASSNAPLLPSAALVLGGALWGVMWVPIRALEQAGLDGAWPTIAMFSAALTLLLPLILLRARRLAGLWLPLMISGLLAGAAFSFYGISLALTEVVRAVLLFYLTPIWGTALGLIFLGERLTPLRIIALLGGVGGLVAILGGDGLPLPRNAGDWLALTSGFAWAFGSLAIYRLRTPAINDQIIAFVAGSIVVALGAVLIAGDTLGSAPAGARTLAALPLAFLAGAYIVPVIWLTIWPASLLSPGRVGLLLMSDVVVGVATAAAFAGELFGWREAFGTILIVGASAVAVLERQGH